MQQHTQNGTHTEMLQSLCTWMGQKAAPDQQVGDCSMHALCNVQQQVAVPMHASHAAAGCQ
jgi:hypothetical protein